MATRTSRASAAGGPESAANEATQKHIRGSSLLLGGRFLSLGINFAIQILIVRYLSKADYGAWAYALSLVSLAVGVATFGLDRSITRFIPIYDEEKEYDKLWGTIAMVVGTILSMGLFAVMAKPRAIFFRKYVLGPLLRLTVVLLLVLSGAGVTFLAAGFVASGAFTVGLYGFFLYRTVRSEGLIEHLSWARLDMPWREVFGFTVPLLASDLLYMVMNTTDALLVGHYNGAEGVGALRVILPAAHLNQIVFTSFTLLFTPAAARLFARGDTEGISNLYWQTAAWIAVLSFPIFALTFSLSNPLTVAIYGARYESSATY